MASPSKSSPASNPAFKLSRTKSKKKHFVQQKVEVLRASDPVRSVFMWGINHTVNDLSQVPVPVMLLPDDFKANSKIKVNNHLFNKENLPGHFKFKEYCPQVFRNLRERFGIEDHDYQVSLARSPPIKDGSSQEERLLLTSYDRTLIIRQISSEEVEEMHHILSEYHQHIVTCHGITLLPQFLGMYRVTVDNEDTYLTVTRNMFSHRLIIHRKYDLKGSLVSREASDKEKEKELPTFKDMDFRNNMQRIYISDEETEKLMDKLNRDVEFLVRLKIMDYSLLLGIHDMERAEREEEEEFGDSPCEEEEEPENGVSSGSPAVGSPSTSPEGIAGYMSTRKPFGPGEFDPYVDVYAIQGGAVPADGAVGVEVEGHQAFWTCDYKPSISVLTTVPPHTDSLGVSTKTKAGLVCHSESLHDSLSCVVQPSADGAALTGGLMEAPLLAGGASQREVYFMGLINILTHYDTKKKAAHAAKTVKHGVSQSATSDNPPQLHFYKDGWRDRRADLQTDGRTDGQICRRMEGQTGRSADGWKDRRADLQKNGGTDKQTCRLMEGQTGRSADGWRDRRADLQTNGKTDGQICRRMEGQTGRSADGWRDRWADLQTDGGTDGQTCRRMEGQMGRSADGWRDRRADGQTCRRMEGQMGRSADGWRDRWADLQTDGGTDGQTCRRMEGQMGRSADEWRDRRADLQTDGGTDGQICRWMVGQDEPGGTGRALSLNLHSLVVQSGAEISTVNPEQYGKRFLEFIANIISN
ncbi:hypothetical protein NFI96_033704 [Prochilodus magdalenae]|nr:hypothetical protein NFI96_033704 [Prochilodus magdalenae]